MNPKVVNNLNQTLAEQRARATRHLLVAIYHQWVLDGKPRKDKEGAEVVGAVVRKIYGVRP
jgi:hypothetical protein